MSLVFTKRSFPNKFVRLLFSKTWKKPSFFYNFPYGNRCKIPFSSKYVPRQRFQKLPALMKLQRHDFEMATFCFIIIKQLLYIPFPGNTISKYDIKFKTVHIQSIPIIWCVFLSSLHYPILMNGITWFLNWKTLLVVICRRNFYPSLFHQISVIRWVKLPLGIYTVLKINIQGTLISMSITLTPISYNTQKVSPTLTMPTNICLQEWQSCYILSNISK